MGAHIQRPLLGTVSELALRLHVAHGADALRLEFFQACLQLLQLKIQLLELVRLVQQDIVCGLVQVLLGRVLVLDLDFSALIQFVRHTLLSFQGADFFQLPLFVSLLRRLLDLVHALRYRPALENWNGRLACLCSWGEARSQMNKVTFSTRFAVKTHE